MAQPRLYNFLLPGMKSKSRSDHLIASAFLCCGRWDLNPHGITVTRTLILLVYQFRHFRIQLNAMQKKGLEPSPCCQDRHLKPARLPIPPLLQAIYLSQARHILTREYGFVNRKFIFVIFSQLCKFSPVLSPISHPPLPAERHTSPRLLR